MATFELERNGKIYEIEAPDAQSAATAFQGFSQQTPAPVEQPVPSLSAGETAADIAKSAGIGVAQGAIGLATLPGNVEYLGRAGIDKAATALGYEDPGFSKDTALPTYQDAKQFVEGYTGEFYKPQTTAGEYARTIGEFAPMAAFGGGGVAARALNVAAPAVVSETAGQLTKGTDFEPYARAAGALAGGFVPNAAMRAVTPVRVDPNRAGHVNTLQNEGVQGLTAGDISGNKALRWAESHAADIPGGAGAAQALRTQQAEQFTAAALRRAGINANRATPDVVDTAFRDLGNRFDQMALSTTVNLDGRFRHAVANAVQDYNHVVPASQRAPLIENLLTDMRAQARGPQFMTGSQYQTLRSTVERLRRGSGNDPQRAQALSNIREALDDAMGRSLPAQAAGEWRNLRGQYRNMLAIEDAIAGAGEQAAMGLISPSSLRNAVKKQGKRRYVRGQGDLGPLARAGEAILKPLPNSGTAPRMAFNDMTAAGGAAVGAMAGGAPGAALGAVLGPLAKGAVARSVYSRPIQGYLTNQQLAPAIENFNALMMPAQARIPNALMQLPPEPLRGGIGPRYDENGNRIR